MGVVYSPEAGILSMTIVSTDIDIDFADRLGALEGLAHVPAAVVSDGRRQRHPSGAYFQEIPFDPLTGLAAFDFKQAAELGYFKVDFLNNSIYEGVQDEDHLDRLMNQEVDWELFLNRGIVDQLSHVAGHYGIIHSIQPKSIEDLAVVLALIRPGKRHLVGQARAAIDAEIWQPSSDGYEFKRAHAIAYAVSIVVQLNLIWEKELHAMLEENVETIAL